MLLFFCRWWCKIFGQLRPSSIDTSIKLVVVNFFRANKSVIVNVNKIKSLSPAFGGRFDAVLKNEYRVIISRNYVPKLKELLGL